MERILAHMKKHADQRVWDYFEFAFMTGMRPEELIALRRGDVDWASGTSHVSRARTAGEEKPLKTYVARDIDLVDRAVEALKVMKVWTGVGAVVDEDRELGRHIIQSPVTDRPWHEDRSQRDTFWRPCLRKLGIRWRRPYQTRHTYATNALRAQVNPTYVARQMGHANAKMLFRVYATWIDRSDRGEIKRSLRLHSAGGVSPQFLPKSLKTGPLQREKLVGAIGLESTATRCRGDLAQCAIEGRDAHASMKRSCRRLARDRRNPRC
ncbi:site-specific integrase [Variovorax sp.]|jgi:integrase|uniref:site-specific integrase n=1 Tax=Variovorax sp. TaxID=1871043 RepID=UPI0037DA29FB